MKVGGSADINHSVCQSNLYLQSQNLEPLFEKFWTNISISAQETLGKSIEVGLSDKKTHFPNAGFVVKNLLITIFDCFEIHESIGKGNFDKLMSYYGIVRNVF